MSHVLNIEIKRVDELVAVEILPTQAELPLTSSFVMDPNMGGNWPAAVTCDSV